MPLEKLQAIVLSHSDYGESDRIVSLFTLEHGFLKGFARGARNSRKRFGPALETCARIDLQLHLKSGLSSVRSADVIALYQGIRSDLNAIALALCACELVECLAPEGQPLPRLYRLLVTYLECLDANRATTDNRRMFEINLLNILGYRPSLEVCSRCGSEYDNRGALLQQGGELACRFCATTGRAITLAALRQLGQCLSTGRFGHIAFEKELLPEVGQLLDEALATHAARKLKSLEFLQQTCGTEEP